MNWFPFFVVATEKKENRGRMAEAMLPAMLSLPPTQQSAVTALAASQQVRASERREVQVADDVISATDAAVTTHGKLDDADLKKFPRLESVIKRNPATRQRIESLAKKHLDNAVAASGICANEVLKGIDKAVKAGGTLADNDLADLIALKAVIGRTPGLRTEIEQLVQTHFAGLQAIESAVANHAVEALLKIKGGQITQVEYDSLPAAFKAIVDKSQGLKAKLVQ